MRNEEMIKISL